MTAETKSLKERVTKALNSQLQKTITVLSSLLAVQDELGYIPEEAIDEVAALTNSTINDVWGVASFYTNFRFTRPGAHKVELCWGPACHVQGAMQVIRSVLDSVGLDGEGDTLDGRVSVSFNTCLGACSQGPVISVDYQLIGRLSPAKVRTILQLYQARAEGARKEAVSRPPG